MKRTMFAAVAAVVAAAAFGAVPIKWTVETSRVQPVAFQAVRGETLALEAAFLTYSKPLQLEGKTFSLLWQTNGMGSAWWTAPASVESNRVTATFTPQMDPGGDTIRGFLGATGDIYRAAFSIRMQRGPGAVPNAIEGPVKVLDLGATTVVNPPWPTTNDFTAATNALEAALKAYVDGEIAGAGVVTPQGVTNITGGVVTGVVTKAYVEGLGVKAGLETNDVVAIVSGKRDMTNLVVTAAVTDWDLSGEIPEGYTVLSNKLIEVLGRYVYRVYVDPENLALYDIGESTVYGGWESADAAESATYGAVITGSSGSYGHMVQKAVVTQAVNLATTDSLAVVSNRTEETTAGLAVVSNRTEATAAGLTVVSNRTEATAARVEALSNTVASVVTVVSGEDAKFQVTNYNSSAKLPEASLQMKITEGGGSTWLKVWDEMTRWNAFTGTNFTWTGWGGFAGWADGIETRLADKGEKEWGFFDSATGAVAPTNTAWLGQPQVVLAAGKTPGRYVTSNGGEIWVIEANGLLPVLNTDTNGVFRVCDLEGNAQFEVVKGGSVIAHAVANSMTATNVNGVAHYYVEYLFTNSVVSVSSPPVAYATTNLLALSSAVAEGTAGCPVTASWTSSQAGGITRYVLEWWPNGDYPQMFLYVRYGAGTAAKIVNHAPVQMETLVVGGVTYTLGTATVGGHTVLTLTPQ